MSLAMFAASINEENFSLPPKKKMFNKTQRQKSDRVNSMIETLQSIETPSSNVSSIDTGENLQMGDYKTVEMKKPIKYPEIEYPMDQNEGKIKPYDEELLYHEPFTAQPPLNPQDSLSVLLKKVNYLITLIEGQQDEKTANTTEEVVLYFFLGIFIIFIIDSFVRVGKYIR